MKDAGQTAPSPKQPWWRKAIRLIGPALFAWFVFTVDLHQVSQALRQVSVLHLGGAIFLCVGVVLIKGYRWQVLLRQLGYREALSTSLVVYGDGMFWGTLTPGRLGEFRKLVHLHRRHGISWIRGAWFNALDRVFDVAVIVILFCSGVLWLTPDVRSMFHPEVFAALLGVCLLAIIFKNAACVPLMKWGASGTGRLHQMAHTGAKDCTSITLAATLWLVLVSLASMLLFIAMIRTLSLSLPFNLTFAQVTLCVVASMLAGIIPVSYFNLGSRELVLVGLFRVFGLTKDNAFSLSLLFLACYLILMFVGLFSWLCARRSSDAFAGCTGEDDATSEPA